MVFSPSPIIFPEISCALFAITSFTFMLDCVPDPVCQITKGNWSSNLPAKISSHTSDIKSLFSELKTPSSAFVCAAAFLR